VSSTQGGTAAAAAKEVDESLLSANGRQGQEARIRSGLFGEIAESWPRYGSTFNKEQQQSKTQRLTGIERDRADSAECGKVL
jgi:hypothetical protein